MFPGTLSDAAQDALAILGKVRVLDATDIEQMSSRSLEEIAAMKLVAVTDRSTKKDFIDLYTIAKRQFTLEEMMEFYDQKYHVLEQNRLTLFKGLQFFEEANEAAMPVMLEEVNWEDVKAFFRNEVVRLWKQMN